MQLEGLESAALKLETLVGCTVRWGQQSKAILHRCIDQRGIQLEGCR